MRSILLATVMFLVPATSPAQEPDVIHLICAMRLTDGESQGSLDLQVDRPSSLVTINSFRTRPVVVSPASIRWNDNIEPDNTESEPVSVRIDRYTGEIFVLRTKVGRDILHGDCSAASEHKRKF